MRSLDNKQDEASDTHSRKRTATDQSGGDSEDSEDEPQKKTQPSDSKLKKQKVKAAEDKAHTRCRTLVCDVCIYLGTHHKPQDVR